MPGRHGKDPLGYLVPQDQLLKPAGRTAWCIPGHQRGAGCPRIPLAQTLVAMSTFSLPSRKRWMTLARCTTVSSAVRMATWCPSRLIFPDSQSAILRVCTHRERLRTTVPPPESPAPFEGAHGSFQHSPGVCSFVLGVLGGAHCVHTVKMTHSYYSQQERGSAGLSQAGALPGRRS